MNAPSSAEDPVLEAIATDADGNQISGNWRGARAIAIRAPVVAQHHRRDGGWSCRSWYSLTLTLEGPAGFEPFPRPQP